MTNRDCGQIIFWAGEKGYGFIRPNHGERDIFVHVTDCEMPDPQRGDKVSYEVGADRRRGKEGGLCALHVRLVSEEGEAPREKALAGLFKTEAVSGTALADWLTCDQK